MESEELREDLLQVEGVLWVLNAPTGIGIYDFSFDRFMACRRPYRPPVPLTAIARVGAIADYRAYYQRWADTGVILIHTPDEHVRASELPGWYPLIEDLTPRSLHFRGAPDVERIERELGWPIFMKGARQTNRHRKSLSIIESRDALARALDEYARDAVLSWQDIVCRQYVPLRPVESIEGDHIPHSFEFRTFWWRGDLAGFGRYWWEGVEYTATETERAQAVAVGAEAAARVDVPFVVVDLAQTAEGRWIVVECNDGQESGYAGVSPFGLWQSIVELERGRVS